MCSSINIVAFVQELTPLSFVFWKTWAFHFLLTHIESLAFGQL